MFVLGLVLDDALLYAVLLAARGGLLWSPFDRAKLLLVGWLLYVVAVVLLTHGEARYRHFVLPVLLPYAAWLLVNLGTLRRAGTLGPGWRWAAVVAGVVLLWSPLMQQYPWSWAGRNLGRGWAMQRAEAAAGAGNTAGALSWDERAAEHDPEFGRCVACPWYVAPATGTGSGGARGIRHRLWPETPVRSAQHRPRGRAAEAGGTSGRAAPFGGF